MQPILIRKDDYLIAKDKKHLADTIKEGQEVYDMFKKIGIEVTPKEIHDFLHMDYTGTPSGYVKEFVLKILIKKAGEPQFNGVPIKKEKIRDMIDVPETSDIEKRLREMKTTWDHNINTHKSFKLSYVEVKDGKLMPKEGTHDEIEAKHTHYTKTEKGNEVVGKLLDLSKHISQFSASVGEHNDYLRCSLGDFKIPGLVDVFEPLPINDHKTINMGNDTAKLINKKHVGHKIDLDFIRKIEKHFSK